MKTYHIIIFFLFILGYELMSAHEDETKNRIALQVEGGLGAHLRLSYERRINNIFGLESGVTGGANFFNTRLSRAEGVGVIFATNIYFTRINDQHQLYLAPMLSIKHDWAVIATGKEETHRFNAISINPSAYFIYRYLFSFRLSLEAGIGMNISSILIPLKQHEPVEAFSWPLPKIHLGIGYSF